MHHSGTKTQSFGKVFAAQLSHPGVVLAARTKDLPENVGVVKRRRKEG